MPPAAACEFRGQQSPIDVVSLAPTIGARGKLDRPAVLEEGSADARIRRVHLNFERCRGVRDGEAGGGN